MPLENKSETVQFRATPTEKYELISAAKEADLTLSEYVSQEILLKKSDAFRVGELEDILQDLKRTHEQEKKALQNEIEASAAQIDKLQKDLQFFKMKPMAISLFNRFEGHIVEIYDKSKSGYKRQLNTIKDVYEFINIAINGKGSI